MEPIAKSIAILSDPACIWRLLTDPAHIKVWYSDCGIEVRADWAVGGAMTAHGDFHGTRLEGKGRILALEAERLLSYTYWSSLSEFPDTEAYYTVIRLELERSESGTTLSLEQTNYITPESRAHWNFYWNVALDRIRRLAESGTIM